MKLDLTELRWEVVKSENADRAVAGNFSWHLTGKVGHAWCCSAASLLLLFDGGYWINHALRSAGQRGAQNGSLLLCPPPPRPQKRLERRSWRARITKLRRPLTSFLFSCCRLSGVAQCIQKRQRVNDGKWLQMVARTRKEDVCRSQMDEKLYAELLKKSLESVWILKVAHVFQVILLFKCNHNIFKILISYGTQILGSFCNFCMQIKDIITKVIPVIRPVTINCPRT